MKTFYEKMKVLPWHTIPNTKLRFALRNYLLDGVVPEPAIAHILRGEVDPQGNTPLLHQGDKFVKDFFPLVCYGSQLHIDLWCSVGGAKTATFEQTGEEE